MSVHLYFLLSAVMLLFVCFLFISGLRRQRERDMYEAGLENEHTFKCDKSESLAAELSSRIFCAEDSEFVSQQASPSVARAFRQERTVLAIEWLCGVRRQVNYLFRSHLKAARQNPDLTPSGELRLGMQFLTFQIATGILYAIVYVRGPLGAAKLVLISQKLSEKLRKMAADLLPSSSAQASVELFDLQRHVHNGRAGR